MNRESLYETDDDEEEDDIGEDLEDIRRACMVSELNSGEVTAKSGSIKGDGGGCGGIRSDSENEDDFELLRSIKSQLASSTEIRSGPPMGLSVHSDSDDDFEMLRSLKSQSALSKDACLPPMSLSDDDEDPNGAFMNDYPGMTQQVHASDSEPSSEILSRSNTCESFPYHGKSVVTVPDSEGVQAGHSVDVHENTVIVPLDQTCQSSLLPAASSIFPQPVPAFPYNGKSVVTVPDSEGVQAGHSFDVHENTVIVPLDQTCQSSLLPAASSSFPQPGQDFVDAISRNRAYQKFIRKKLTEIEAKIEQNKKHQKNVKIVKDFHASCKRITKQALSHGKDPRVQLISTRKCGPRDSSEGNDKKTCPLTLGPPENGCVANYRMVLKKHLMSVDRRSWSSKENENLAKGLKQQVQETLLNEAIERSSDLQGSTDDIDTINESIKNVEITPAMIQQFLPKVNWDQLASLYFKERSAAECEARWMSSEDPLINHSPWTAEEENNLRLIIQEKGFTDWLEIAVALGTNRTPFQCLARYQRSLNADILRKEWTAEDDDQLRAAVELFGEKDWQSVANALEGRAGTQCSNRWKKSLHPTRKKVGKFCSEEDKRLTVAVTLFGAQNWHKIAHFVPGRTQTQCRERWVNSLDPNLNRGKWTEEEDAKLREAINKHGCGKWAKIASNVSRRTDSQCRWRWMNLYPHQVPLVQEATRLRREAIAGNFVDREAERPALLAGDFLALPEKSLEPELLNKKRKARQKKSNAGCESEASCAATEKQPKRRKDYRDAHNELTSI